MTADEAEYGIAELAQLGSVSRRTVRYYVQRGLLPAPTGTGRGRHYTQQHLDTLVRIRQLQEKGVDLNDIALRLSGVERPEPTPSRMPAPTQNGWLRVLLADGVELHLKRTRALDAATLKRLSQALIEALPDA
jgi:DNA-binding transcriptional MerR regulator